MDSAVALDVPGPEVIDVDNYQSESNKEQEDVKCYKLHVE